MVRTKVLLVDEQQIMREGLRALLHGRGDVEVIGEADGGRAAISKTRDLSPDVVVMDSVMRDMDCTDFARQIKHLRPETRLLVLSGNNSAESGLSVLRAGADGYVPKHAASSELVSAIAAVRRGDSYVPQTLAVALIRQCRQVQTGQTNSLTESQNEILRLIVDGKTSIQIADILGLSLVSVKTERRKIMRKVRVRNLIELVRFGLRQGIGLERRDSEAVA